MIINCVAASAGLQISQTAAVSSNNMLYHAANNHAADSAIVRWPRPDVYNNTVYNDNFIVGSISIQVDHRSRVSNNLVNKQYFRATAPRHRHEQRDQCGCRLVRRSASGNLHLLPREQRSTKARQFPVSLTTSTATRDRGAGT